MKYVVITGGVVSGLGKGITASSVGRILKECGLRVTAIKIDPYLNIDAGTMSPYEHGEVFVLDDGGEVDLDLGNYERFLDVTLTRDHNITTGKVYKHVLDLERKGAYLGKTVQMVPHITNAVKDWIVKVSQIPVDGSNKPPNVCVVELGGTVGDIESMVFLEALRQLKFQVGSQNFCHIHVSLIVTVGAVGEQKSKPTQHSVRALREAGLIPNIIVCRASEPITRPIRQKVSLFSMVPPNHVISVHDVKNIYEVPRLLLDQNVVSLVLNALNINRMPPLRNSLDDLSQKIENCSQNISIGIVGKYTGLSDSYISLIKAVKIAGLSSDLNVNIVWIESTDLEPLMAVDMKRDYGSPRKQDAKEEPFEALQEKRDSNSSRRSSHSSMDDSSAELKKHKRAWEDLEKVDGILIPGGFGDRGVEGKIRAVEYARRIKKPFLGICLGMQCVVIEYARHVCKMKKANSAEFNPDTKYPVVIFMPEISQHEMGGTMRLGSRACQVKPDSLAHQLYGKEEIQERHRHRYEVNPEYIGELEKAGLIFSGKDALGERMEITELPPQVHPYFFSCQFHPEFKSGPTRPSPPFVGLVRAASGRPPARYSTMRTSKSAGDLKENVPPSAFHKLNSQKV